MDNPTMTCQYCFSGIDERAKKCPHCQSFQKGIYNPQTWAAILPIVFLVPLLFFTFSRLDAFSEDEVYEDYVDQFRTEFVITTMESKGSEITYRIFNESDVKWEGIHYQAIGYGDDEAVITSVTDQNRDWVILPKSDALLTIKASDHPKVKGWKLKILDCREASKF
jgi:hypothetical protein